MKSHGGGVVCNFAEKIAKSFGYGSFSTRVYMCSGSKIDHENNRMLIHCRTVFSDSFFPNCRDFLVVARVDLHGEGGESRHNKESDIAFQQKGPFFCTRANFVCEHPNQMAHKSYDTGIPIAASTTTCLP